MTSTDSKASGEANVRYNPFAKTVAAMTSLAEGSDRTATPNPFMKQTDPAASAEGARGPISGNPFLRKPSSASNPFSSTSSSNVSEFSSFLSSKSGSSSFGKNPFLPTNAKGLFDEANTGAVTQNHLTFVPKSASTDSEAVKPEGSSGTAFKLVIKQAEPLDKSLPPLDVVAEAEANREAIEAEKKALAKQEERSYGWDMAVAEEEFEAIMTRGATGAKQKKSFGWDD